MAVLPEPFLAEHHGRGRLRRVAVDLVPGGMERVADAGALKDQVGLGVLIGERIGGDAVMIEKLLDFHCLVTITRRMAKRTMTLISRPTTTITCVFRARARRLKV